MAATAILSASLGFVAGITLATDAIQPPGHFVRQYGNLIAGMLAVFAAYLGMQAVREQLKDRRRREAIELRDRLTDFEAKLGPVIAKFDRDLAAIAPLQDGALAELCADGWCDDFCGRVDDLCSIDRTFLGDDVFRKGREAVLTARTFERVSNKMLADKNRVCSETIFVATEFAAFQDIFLTNCTEFVETLHAKRAAIRALNEDILKRYIA